MNVEMGDGLSGSLALIHSEIESGGRKLFFQVILAFLDEWKERTSFHFTEFEQGLDMAFGYNQEMSRSNRVLVKAGIEVLILLDGMILGQLTKEAACFFHGLNSLNDWIDSGDMSGLPEGCSGIFL